MEVNFLSSHLNKTSSLQLAGLAVCPEGFTSKSTEAVFMGFFSPNHKMIYFFVMESITLKEIAVINLMWFVDGVSLSFMQC